MKINSEEIIIGLIKDKLENQRSTEENISRKIQILKDEFSRFSDGKCRENACEVLFRRKSD
jgi:predicted translin family RNA/ssDNA-binding protein